MEIFQTATLFSRKKWNQLIVMVAVVVVAFLVLLFQRSSESLADENTKFHNFGRYQQLSPDHHFFVQQHLLMRIVRLSNYDIIVDALHLPLTIRP